MRGDGAMNEYKRGCGCRDMRGTAMEAGNTRLADSFIG